MVKKLKKEVGMNKRKFLALLVVTLVFVISCAKPKPVPISIEDNPAHHYLQGMEAIERGDIEEADRRFERALYLDKDYSPALAGKALVMAIKAGKEAEKEHQKIDMEKSIKYLDKSEDKAEGDTEKFIYHVTGIRVYTEGHPKKWLKKAKNHYEDALDLKKVDEGKLIYYQARSAAHYFMGVAYYKAYEFRKAEETLAKVLSEKPGKWHDRTDTLYKRVQKIVRACGQYTLTDVAKKIAIKEQINRGDVAAMLVDEIHLDRFLAGRIPIKSQIPKADFVPADALNHLFKNEITTIIKWNVRGLEAQYDYTTRAYLFRPEAPVKRKELAFTLEDLLVKLTGDEGLPTAYFGTENTPFPDVPVNVAWFNAVMNVTTRGLMEPELSGEFRPEDYVDGAELLLAVMKLRNVMNIY